MAGGKPNLALRRLLAGVVIVGFILGGWALDRWRHQRQRTQQRQFLAKEHQRAQNPDAAEARAASTDQLIGWLSQGWTSQGVPAAEELGRRKDARGHAQLVTMLQSDNAEARRLGAYGLGFFGDASDFDRLQAAATNTTDDEVASVAMESLGMVPDARVWPVLEAAITSRSASCSVRSAAVRAAAQAREPRALPALEALLKSEDCGRLDAQDALPVLGAEGMKAVLPQVHLDEESEDQEGVTDAIAKGVAATGSPEGIRELILICRSHKDGEARGVAAAALAVRPEPEAQAAYRDALRDADPKVRFEALDALPSDSQTLATLDTMSHDGDPEVRRKVGYRLSGIEDERAAELLAQAVDENNLPLVAGAWEYFAEGDPSSQEVRVLAAAMKDYGTKEMADQLLNGHSGILSEAARQWAIAHGYTVIPTYH
ncbi:MAG TPA: HEAT repeat domain-containing protein [Terriglobales bacterium]|jgi:HEAT repeat protein|nr:HEAT repeat domain-containing protein [Terriglobales bacterium]